MFFKIATYFKKFLLYSVLQRILFESCTSKLISCFICKYILPFKTWLPMCKAVTSLICQCRDTCSSSIYSNEGIFFLKDLNRLHVLKHRHYLHSVLPFKTKSKISRQKIQKMRSRNYCTSKTLALNTKFLQKLASKLA